MMESVWIGAHSDSWRDEEFQILGAAMLKLWTPNDMQTMLNLYCISPIASVNWVVNLLLYTATG